MLHHICCPRTPQQCPGMWTSIVQLLVNIILFFFFFFYINVWHSSPQGKSPRSDLVSPHNCAIVAPNFPKLYEKKASRINTKLSQITQTNGKIYLKNCNIVLPIKSMMHWKSGLQLSTKVVKQIHLSTIFLTNRLSLSKENYNLIDILQCLV